MLNTSLPPWLQNNLKPSDESPWLLNALEKGQAMRQRQEMFPLQLQQMALRNQATSLAVENEAMANEQASIEMQQYREQLPVVNEYFKNAKGNPTYFQSVPPPAVTSPKLQAMILNAQHASAANTYSQQVQKYQIGLTEAAAKLVSLGRYVKPDLDENGQSYFDPTKIAAAAEGLAEEDRQFILQRIAAQTTRYSMSPVMRQAEDTAKAKADLRAAENALLESGAGEETPEILAQKEKIQQAKDVVAALEVKGATGTPITPQITTIQTANGPVEMIVNPKTGHFEPVDKTMSRAQFIAKDIASWVESQGMTPEDAAKQLGEIYDKNIAPGKAKGLPPPDSPSPPNGPLVRVRHPDGRIGYVPSSQLEKARAKGYQEVP